MTPTTCSFVGNTYDIAGDSRKAVGNWGHRLGLRFGLEGFDGLMS